MSRTPLRPLQQTSREDRRTSEQDAEGGSSPVLHAEAQAGAANHIQALMSSGGNVGMVQLSGGDADAGVHQAAAHGIAGGGSQLPHFDAIQRSFGHHDVGGVQSHVGGKAAEASRDMGAEAYATGDHVAFGKQPDLHTAAHEAAHVVQQRGGVQLSGGVGKSGDVYERHADAVADRVVAGQSASDLLDQHAGGKGPSEGVQRLAVQRRADVQLNQSTTPTDKESAGPKITVSETHAFDFALAIPLYGPIKLEGKVAGSYTTKDGSDGPKSEVEGLLYGGILVDLWIVKLRAGIEGKVKFTVAGHQSVLDAVKKGINEIAQWKIAKDFQPKLDSARSSIDYAYMAQVNGYQRHYMSLERELKKGNFEASGKWWFSKSPREWAMWYVEGWNRSLTGRFEGLGAEVDQSKLIDVATLEAKFNKIATTSDKDTGLKYASDAHMFAVNELIRTVTASKKALDQIQVVKNDPKVGFDASIAFKAGVSVQATANASGEVTAAKVVSVGDKEGQDKWDTDAKEATVVTGKVTVGNYEAGLVGNWKKDDVEISGSFTAKHGTATPTEAKHSVGSVFSAVKGAGSAFQMLSSPVATTQKVVSELGKVVADNTKDLTDPAKIAARAKGSTSVGQSFGVEVKLKFSRAGFKLIGGGVKFTLIAAKLEAKSALGAAASVGVSGSVSKGATFEAAW